MWNRNHFFIILMIAGWIVVFINISFFVNIYHKANVAAFRITDPSGTILWISMMSYCISPSGFYLDFTCSEGISFRPQYNVAGLSKDSAEALTAASRSYFTASGTLACFILSVISCILNLVALWMKALLGRKKLNVRRIIAIVAGILAVLSFIIGLVIYIIFCVSLNKVTSSFDYIPDKDVKWGVAMPVCWSIFILFSIIMLVWVLRTWKPQPEPGVELLPLPLNGQSVDTNETLVAFTSRFRDVA